jgi:hypothetical protein
MEEVPTKVPKPREQVTDDDIDWDKVMKNPVLKGVFGSINYSKKYEPWHNDYDKIDWNAKTSKSPILAVVLSGQTSVRTSYAPILFLHFSHV